MGILFGEIVANINEATCEAADQGVSTSYTESIQTKVIQLVYLSFIAFALFYAHASAWSFFSQRLSHRLRESYFGALLRQDPAFFDSRHAGEVSARLNGDIQAVATGTSEKVGMFIASLSFFCTSHIVGFVKDAELAGILVAVVPAFLGMTLVCEMYLQKFAGIASTKIASASRVVAEALDNIAVVQIFGMGERLEAKFSADMLEARHSGIRKSIVSAAQAGLLFFIAYSANGMAFWQGSRKIAAAAQGKGDTSIGEVYTVVSYWLTVSLRASNSSLILPSVVKKKPLTP